METNRTPPEGYTRSYNPDMWNVGHVFRWSNVYDCWLDCELRLTVKPQDTLQDAYFRVVDETLWRGVLEVFFNENF